MKSVNWKVLILSLVVVYAVAFVGSLLTMGNTDGEWYNSVRPSITPPNYVFPIVWNILFFLIALSLYFVWIKSKKKDKKKIILVYGINFLLNIFWSYLFFSLKNPVASFYELILLWFSIASMIYLTKRISKKAMWLLVLYIVWVSFAGVLNWMIAFG
jgi:tryptophan-rich sensory protein